MKKLSDEEILYIHKRTNARLYEPAISPRPGFEFMPYWVHFKEYKCSDFEENRRFHTGFKGNTFTKDLESNILSVIKDKLIVGLVYK